MKATEIDHSDCGDECLKCSSYDSCAVGFECFGSSWTETVERCASQGKVCLTFDGVNFYLRASR